MTGLAQSTRPCTFGVFEEISIRRVEPAPDQSPAPDVRLPNYSGIQVQSHPQWPVWTIEPDRVCLSGSEIINVIVQNVYNVAGRDRISSLSNNTWPCNYTEDFVWDWPYHPKFVTNASTIHLYTLTYHTDWYCGVLQTKSIRSINNSKYNYSSGPIYKNLSILPLTGLYEFETVKFMYLNQRNELPLPLQTLFTTNANIHAHNTRHRHDPHINTMRTETLSHSFIHKAPALWYTVPSQIKNVKTVGSFRSKIKRELLNK